MQVVVKDVGGTIFTDFVGRRPASCNVAVYDSAGAELIPSTGCTVSTVNTTLSVAALQGATAITLTSVAGIVGGRRYVLGNEEVGVKSIAGSVATLWAPLIRDHAIGSAFVGTRVEYTVTAPQAASAWADGYAVFTPVSGETQTEAPVHCSRHKLPDVIMSEYDLREFLPKDEMLLASELDRDVAYASARRNFLTDLGGKAIASAIIGTAQFRRLVTMRLILDREFEFGQQAAVDFVALRAEYTRATEKIVQASLADQDSDGVTVRGPLKHALGALDLEIR